MCKCADGTANSIYNLEMFMRGEFPLWGLGGVGGKTLSVKQFVISYCSIRTSGELFSDHLFLEEVLCYLNRIRSRPFSQIIRNNPAVHRIGL